MPGNSASGITPIPVPSGALWCLTDGAQDFAATIFPSLTEDDIAARLAVAGEATIRTEFNAYLYIAPDGAKTLIDAGCGAEMGPLGGAMLGQLKTLSVAPADIDRIVFTHLHGDHCGGAIDGNEAVFAAAEVCLHPAEIAFAQAGRRTGARALTAYADRIRPVSEGEDICPGLRVWAPVGLGHIRGHTPGHIGVEVDGCVVIAGDIFHSEALQLPDPALGPIYDEDPAMATLVRQAAMAVIADQNLVFSGGHVLGPDKAARLVRVGSGYAKVPA